MKKLGCGLLGTISAAVVLLTVAGWTPAKRCGEVGYYPRLSDVCRAAQAHPYPENYCTADEMRDLHCAAATYADNTRREQEEADRALFTRH